MVQLQDWRVKVGSPGVAGIYLRSPSPTPRTDPMGLSCSRNVTHVGAVASRRRELHRLRHSLNM